MESDAEGLTQGRLNVQNPLRGHCDAPILPLMLEPSSEGTNRGSFLPLHQLANLQG